MATPDDLVVAYYCNNTKSSSILAYGVYPRSNPIELKPCIVTKSMILCDAAGIMPDSWILCRTGPGSYVELAPGSGLITGFTDERTVGALSRLLLERGRGFEGRPRPSPACWAWGRGRG